MPKFDETRGPYYYYIGDLIPASEPWRVTWVGQETDKERHPTEDSVLTEFPDAVLISAPPRIGMGDYLTYELGTGVRWRRAPARKLRWDREGIHALFGVPGGALLVALAYVGGTSADVAPILLGLGIVGIVSWLFIQYEVRESAKISDFAYRDILGYKATTTLFGVIAAAAYILAR